MAVVGDNAFIVCRALADAHLAEHGEASAALRPLLDGLVVLAEGKRLLLLHLIQVLALHLLLEISDEEEESQVILRKSLLVGKEHALLQVRELLKALLKSFALAGVERLEALLLPVFLGVVVEHLVEHLAELLRSREVMVHILVIHLSLDKLQAVFLLLLLFPALCLQLVQQVSHHSSLPTARLEADPWQVFLSTSLSRRAFHYDIDVPHQLVVIVKQDEDTQVFQCV